MSGGAYAPPGPHVATPQETITRPRKMGIAPKMVTVNHYQCSYLSLSFIEIGLVGTAKCHDAFARLSMISDISFSSC